MDSKQPARPSLIQSLYEPLVAARQAYEAALLGIEAIISGLDALLPTEVARPAPPATQDLPAAPAAPPAAAAIELDVAGGAAGLAEFEEALGQIPGVLRVTASEVVPGRTTFAVTLAPVARAETAAAPAAAPVRAEIVSVVCAWCGKILSLGSGQVSHGLCADCARDAAARGQASPRPPSPEPPAPTLVYLFRVGERWVERRIMGDGRREEAPTGFPSATPAHEVLERMSARYPGRLVVVSGEGGTTLASGSVSASGSLAL